MTPLRCVCQSNEYCVCSADPLQLPITAPLASSTQSNYGQHSEQHSHVSSPPFSSESNFPYPEEQSCIGGESYEGFDQNWCSTGHNGQFQIHESLAGGIVGGHIPYQNHVQSAANNDFTGAGESFGADTNMLHEDFTMSENDKQVFQHAQLTDSALMATHCCQSNIFPYPIHETTVKLTVGGNFVPGPCLHEYCQSRKFPPMLKDLCRARTHYRIVHGEKKHLCPAAGCGIAFGDSSTLDRHFLARHLPEGRTRCSISGCQSKSKGFDKYRRERLVAHNKKFHGPFICEIDGCVRGASNGFANEEELRKHMTQKHSTKPHRNIKSKMRATK